MIWIDSKGSQFLRRIRPGKQARLLYSSMPSPRWEERLKRIAGHPFLCLLLLALIPIVLRIALVHGHAALWPGVLCTGAAFCALSYWMLRGWMSPAWSLVGG